MSSEDTQFKKGRVLPPEIEKKRRINCIISNTGQNAWNWKTSNISMTAIHTWVKRYKGTPSKCESCGTEKAKKFEWANIDHKYNRVLDDYIRMCTKCHRNYDYSNRLCNIGSRGGSIPNKKNI